MIGIRLPKVTLLATLIIAANLANAYAEDADSVTLDGRTYRLDGIDAPEIDQTCIDGVGENYPCGRVAAQVRKDFIAGRMIYCDDLGPDPAYSCWRIGQCTVGDIELNRWLVRVGRALNFEPYARGRFKGEEDSARVGHLGIWKGCFVTPLDFRRQNKRTARLLGSSCPPNAREKLFPAEVRMPPGCEIKGT